MLVSRANNLMTANGRPKLIALFNINTSLRRPREHTDTAQPCAAMDIPTNYGSIDDIGAFYCVIFRTSLREIPASQRLLPNCTGNHTERDFP